MHPSRPRTASRHTSTRVSALAPGVGMLTCGIPLRRAGTNWATSHLFSGETLVSTAGGGSAEGCSHGRVSRRGPCIRRVHSPAPDTADVPRATCNSRNRLGKSLPILVSGAAKAISLPTVAQPYWWVRSFERSARVQSSHPCPHNVSFKLKVSRP